MGKRLVIESLEVRTDTRSVTYVFRTGVNAVTGPVGSGKSSMLELLKYSLGGSAKVMPAVRDNVQSVKVKFRAGDEHWEFTRALRSHVVQVFDLKTQESLGEWAATNRQNSRKVGPALLDALGLPPDWRIPKSRKNPTDETVPVSFWDVHKYLYLDQNSIDASVIGHKDANLNNKRIAVFELIYGLANARTVELLTERGKRRAEASALRKSAEAVSAFLQDMGDPDPAELTARKAGLLIELGRSKDALNEARNAAQSGLVSAETLNALGSKRAHLEDLLAQRDALQVAVAEAKSVTAQLNLEEQRIKRSSGASRSLSGLEFVQCPRCLQGLPYGRFDDGHCHLCGQAQEPDANDNAADSLLKVLREQRRETKDLADADEATLEGVSAQIELAEQAVLSQLRAASNSDEPRALPYIGSLEQAVAQVAVTEAAIQRIDDVEKRWATHDGLHKEADNLDVIARGMAKEESRIKLGLREDTPLLAGLSELFDEILRGLRDPWFNKAHVDTTDYLPIVDGEPFDMLAVGGGRKTIVNLAYHVANLYMSLSERTDMLLPTLLIVDSPRKNVGEGALDRAVVESIYSRLRTLQDASRDDFQMIFADNDMPTEASKWVSQHISLDYDNPFVPGVVHRGEQEPNDPKTAEEID
ncbi:AAA family ATPase [Ornithinimicrobium cryptoxanthini]|uniref:AAA family ATPase n=1 Tax=Ornithinimicrobium cryptoxanthini TaxID=2934161 RepID=A0ABY4YM60_9MICO|nr:AAA family ATPase [Ornithinimicrobium cryptoxanthini]USQ77806.1 AAA family ATPase [Ornithinimicrobium cryptoxanthini]